MTAATPPSLAAQITAAVEVAGGQSALAQRVRDAGGRLTQPRVSALVGGQTPDVATLAAIARATGVAFVITGETDVGRSRPTYASDQPRRQARRKVPAGA